MRPENPLPPLGGWLCDCFGGVGLCSRRYPTQGGVRGWALQFGRYGCPGVAGYAEAVRGGGFVFRRPFGYAWWKVACMKRGPKALTGLPGVCRRLQAGMDGLDGCLRDTFPDDLFLSGCNADPIIGGS